MTALRFSIFAFAFLLLLPGIASAHESRPLHIQISERASDIFAVNWRVPASVEAQNIPQLTFPSSCETKSSGPQARLLSCPGGLSGKMIKISYPKFNPSISTIIRLTRLSGEVRMAALGPDKLAWEVPDKETALGVAKSYLVLGVEHILGGYDHLLFIACLAFIAGTWRRILITVTGFTLAHSITLALAALGVVRLPVPPVEAVIALSIVFLATEIARGRRDSLTWRYPVTVAASFGLLHGFGFASALSEIGLPQTELLTALFFFNVGVELGQVAFVVLILALVWAFRKSGIFKTEASDSMLDLPAWAEKPAAYVIGSLAAMWMFERIAGFWA